MPWNGNLHRVALLSLRKVGVLHRLRYAQFYAQVKEELFNSVFRFAMAGDKEEGIRQFNAARIFEVMSLSAMYPLRIYRERYGVGTWQVGWKKK